MTTQYEWLVEVVQNYEDDPDTNDIIDVHHSATAAGMLRDVKDLSRQLEPGQELHYGLVKDAQRGSAYERSWCYVAGGTLSDRFEDAYQRDCGKVPQKLIAEYARATA